MEITTAEDAHHQVGVQDELTTAGIEMPKPTQVGVQEEELKPETVSEEIVIKDEGVPETVSTD